MKKTLEQYENIDIELGDFFERLTADTTGKVNTAIRDLSAAVRSGSSCIVVPDKDLQNELLKHSAVFGTCQQHDLSTPLIFDGNLLYFQKQLKKELELAGFLRDIADRNTPELPPDKVDEAFSPLPPSAGVDHQKRAVRNALRTPFAIISGGPGTGKTTVASVLLYHELMRKDPPRIAITAPTGKAFFRLKESLNSDIKKFQIPEAFKEQLTALPGGTIHRLLGWTKNGFSFNRENPLPYDLLVVDEASMISQDLMLHLVSAMSKDCRMILLGDYLQLSSIESGTVFADLCTASENAPENSAMSKIMAKLTFNFRAGEVPELVQLFDKLRTGQLPDDYPVASVPRRKQEIAEKLAPYLAVYRKIAKLCASGSEEDLQKAFALLDDFMIITALRGKSIFGAEGINQLVMNALNLKPDSPGVPVIILRNDANLQLFNGDIGLTVKNGNVRFPERQTCYSLAELPELTQAYAITAHKSQGSGYSEILMILPPEETPVLTLSLLYTAATRARKKLTIWGSRKILKQIAQQENPRTTGLATRLF